jgi:hypothetical protein
VRASIAVKSRPKFVYGRIKVSDTHALIARLRRLSARGSGFGSGKSQDLTSTNMLMFNKNVDF